MAGEEPIGGAFAGNDAGHLQKNLECGAKRKRDLCAEEDAIFREIFREAILAGDGGITDAKPEGNFEIVAGTPTTFGRGWFHDVLLASEGNGRSVGKVLREDEDTAG